MSAQDSNEDPNGIKIAQEMVPIIHMVRRAVLKEKGGQLDLTQEIERIADKLCNLEHFLENYEELHIVNRLKSEIKAHSSSLIPPTDKTTTTSSPGSKSTDMVLENDDNRTVSMSALDATQVKSLLRPQSSGSTGSTGGAKWRKGSGLESIRENLLSDIAQSISSMANGDALSTVLPASSSHNSSNKKHKSHGVSLFDNFNFDDLPPYEPLEACLSLLRNDATSLAGIDKLMNFDVEELVEHPQWYELIMLLHRALVVSREDTAEEMNEVSNMIEVMKEQREGGEIEDIKCSGTIANKTAVLSLYMKYINELQGQQRVDLVCSLLRYCIEKWCPSFGGNTGDDSNDIQVSPTTHGREQFDIPLLSKLEVTAFSIALQCVFEDMLACSDKSTDTVLCLAMIAMSYGTITVSLTGNTEGDRGGSEAKMKVLDALGIISDPVAADSATILSFPKPQTALLHSLSVNFLSTLIDRLLSLQTIEMKQYKDAHPSQRILLVGSYLHTLNMFLTIVCPYFRQGDEYTNRVLSYATDNTLKAKTGTWDGTIAPILGTDPQGGAPMSHTSVDHIRNPLSMVEVAECNRLYLQCTGCHFDIRAFIALPDDDDANERAKYSSNNGTDVDDPDLPPRYSTLPAETQPDKVYDSISGVNMSFGPFLLMVLEKVQALLVNVTYRASLECLCTLCSLLEHCVTYAKRCKNREMKRRIVMIMKDIVGVYPSEWGGFDELWDGQMKAGKNTNEDTSIVVDEEVEIDRSAYMASATRSCYEDMMEFYLIQLESLTESIEDGPGLGEGLLLDLLIPTWLEVTNSDIIQEDLKLCQQGMEYCEGGRAVRLRSVYYGWQMVLHLAQGERSVFWHSQYPNSIDYTAIGPLLCTLITHCTHCLSQPTLPQDLEGVDSLDARHRMAIQYYYAEFLLSVLYNYKITQAVFFPMSNANSTHSSSVLFQQGVDLLLQHICKESIVYSFKGDPDHRAELASTLLHVCQDNPLALTTSVNYPLLVEWVSQQLEGQNVSELASAWYDSSDTTFSLLQLLFSLSFTSSGPVVIHALLLAAWPAYNQWCCDHEYHSLSQVCCSHDWDTISFEDALPLLLRVLQVCMMSQSFCLEVMYHNDEMNKKSLKEGVEILTESSGGYDLCNIFKDSVKVQLRQTFYWTPADIHKRYFWLPEDEVQLLAANQKLHDTSDANEKEHEEQQNWGQRSDEDSMDTQASHSIPEPHSVARSVDTLPAPPTLYVDGTHDTSPPTGIASFFYEGDNCCICYCTYIKKHTLPNQGVVLTDASDKALKQYIKDIYDTGANSTVEPYHFAANCVPFLAQCALIFSLSANFIDPLKDESHDHPSDRPRKHLLQTLEYYLPISNGTTDTVTFLRSMHDQVVHTALCLLFEYDDGLTLGIYRSRHISHRGVAEQVVHQWFGKYVHMDDCLFITSSCLKHYHDNSDDTSIEGKNNKHKSSNDSHKDEDPVGNNSDGICGVSAVPALVLCLILIRIADGIRVDWRCEGGIEQVTRVINTPAYAFRLVDEDVLPLYRRLAELHSS